MIEKLRSFRIKGIALFDLVGSFLIMILIAILLHRTVLSGYDRNKLILVFVILTIPLGIVTHYAFGIKTTLNKYIGL